MKKSLVIVACISTTFAHGMQTTLFEITEKSLSILTHGTTINLFKGSSYYPSNPINITVVGKHQQNMLQEGYDNLNNIGRIYCNEHIHERNKDNDSTSDDDTYHPHPNQIEKQTWRDSHKIKSSIMHVEEPCISNSTRSENRGIYSADLSECIHFTIPALFINNFVYQVHRKVPTRREGLTITKFPGCYTNETYVGDEAIKEAGKDLALCYKKALTKGFTKLQYSSEENSIALPTLGADVGFPRAKAAPIAVATVLEYVKNNPGKYESINFFVEKRSDFPLYKKLLMQECNLIERICLLFCANKDHNHFLSHIPLDVITQILLLMANV